MKKLFFAFLFFPFLLSAQTDSIIKGIKWTTGLSWEQVKQKAKTENKFIFLDCFASWCGPCKAMDRYIYTNDTLGSYFNDKFISVKVQMDKTAKDNSFIKSWYDAASSLNRNYGIDAYPSFIFFSPNGEILHKAMGFQRVTDLISVAKIAIAPGKVYGDPYSEYFRLVENYKNGVRDYNIMPYMIRTAYKLDDDDFGKQLLNEHTDYALSLKPEVRYTQENIKLWAGFMLKSDGPRFKFFYNDGQLIDSVMNQKGFSQALIDRTIEYEIVDPFFRRQQGEAITVTGKIKNNQIMSKQLPVSMDGRITPDYVEANWKKLERMLRRKTDKESAKRITLKSRVKWYKQHSNYPAYIKYALIQYAKYTPDYLGADMLSFNQFGWDAFLYITDKAVLNQVAEWIKKAANVIRFAPIIDTYASLLYKIGRKTEAIEWEEKALKLMPQSKDFQTALRQMKNNERTYLNEGAIWDGIIISKN